MASRRIGQAFINVTAQLARGTTAKLGTQLNRALSRAGTTGGRTFGQRLGAALRSSMTRSGNDAGKQFLGVFSRKVALNIGAFSTQIGATAGNSIVGAMAVALVASAPILGAAINSAIVLGISGGVLAAGIAAAARSPKVKKAWGVLGKTGQKVFAAFGKPFVGPVLRALSGFNRALLRMQPAFVRIGKAAAPLIDRLSPALIGMVEKMLPGIEKLVNNSAPFFEALAVALPEIGAALGDMFAQISGSEGTLVFFQDFLRFTIGLIKQLTRFLVYLGEEYLYLRAKIIATVNELKIEFQIWRNTWTTVVNAIIVAAKAVWHALQAAGHGIVVAWNATVGALRAAANAVVGFFQSMGNRVHAIFFAIVRFIASRVGDILRGLAVLRQLAGRVGGYFRAAYNAVVGQLTNLVNLVRGIPGRILSALGNLGRLLYNAGRNIIQGLIDGIHAMIGRVRDAISGVTRTIRDHLPFSPAKKGPLAGDGSPLLAGRSIARMLAQGLMRERGRVDRAVNRVLPSRFARPGRAAGSGGGKSLEDLLRELIEVARGIPPGVGAALNGATYATALRGRGL